VRLLRIASVPLAALACAGCMTVDTLTNRGYPGPYTYSGARGDLEIIEQSFLSFNLPLMLLFMLDLPLSAVADTLALPATLPRERARLSRLEQRGRVDIEQPALVTAEPGEQPEATAERLIDRCREASKTLSDALLDCYSIGARITVRSASDPQSPPRKLTGSAYKLELRDALARERQVGDVIDWSEPRFEREGKAVRVTAIRSSARSAQTHPQSWLVGPGSDGGWRILEEDGIGWATVAPRP
jgi:uncharacterized protein YceK